MRAKLVILAVAAAAVLVVASGAPAGGIDDQPCPNVAGENTNTCPSATLGTPYFIRFVEREGSGCGPGRQTFHLDSGIAPPGLTLLLDGTFFGTPVLPGRFRFYVEMREPKDSPETCAGKETQKQFTLYVREPAAIASAPLSPVRSEVGVPVRTTLRARGGTGRFRWSFLGGELPPGVRIERRGSIAGVPRAAGTYDLTLEARDTEKRIVTWRGTLDVAPRLVLRSQRLETARAGDFYSVDFAAAGGVGRRVWTIERGPLPRGLRSARELGRLSGTPQKPGTYRVTMAVRDELGAKATRTFTIHVRPAPPTRPKKR